MSEPAARPLLSFDDDAARAEALRLAKVARARWERHAVWMGFSVEPVPAADDGPTPFEVGMLAMFRFARGENVPEVIVQSFIDDLLNLLFAGLASGALAMPRFSRMRDRPWAVAWQAAELRLKAGSQDPVSVKELAHLLDVEESELCDALGARGVQVRGGHISGPALSAALQALSGSGSPSGS